MNLPFLNLTGLAEKEKAVAIQSLINNSSPRKDFFWMMILSILMAAFGLLLDNAAIIIGSMLIAPLLYPLLSFSLGITILDFKLIYRSLYTILQSTILGIAFSALVVFIFSKSNHALTPEILDRIRPSIDYLAVAVIAGLAASFALMKPNLNERLPGVAISVALIPPLAVIGIGIAWLDWNIIIESMRLYSINIIGVIVASTIMFSIMNLKFQKKVAQKAVKREERAIQKEVVQATTKEK